MNEAVENGEGKQNVQALCARLGMSRQNYYAARRYRQRRHIDEELVVELVRRERRQQPRIGARKLLHILGPELVDAGVSLGRDRFFEVLADRNMLVAPKPGIPHTTDSRHCLPVFRNLVQGLELTGPNQAWVSDLTYIRTDEGFVFAAIIMDLYSRKIVGAHIGTNLETAGCLEALNRALAELPANRCPIHHSDRGCQYCSHLYVERLHTKGLSISMTEQNHCYENAYAERVIGILKQEYGMDWSFRSKDQAYTAFWHAVEMYNHRRPHTSLNYRVPAEVHKQAA